MGIDSVKAQNIHRDSRVALCISTHDKPYKYVVAEGICEIVTDGVAARFLTICMRYYGSERGEQFVLETIAKGDSVILAVTPTRLVTESAA